MQQIRQSGTCRHTSWTGGAECTRIRRCFPNWARSPVQQPQDDSPSLRLRVQRRVCPLTRCEHGCQGCALVSRCNMSHRKEEVVGMVGDRLDSFRQRASCQEARRGDGMRIYQRISSQLIDNSTSLMPLGCKLPLVSPPKTVMVWDS